MILLLWEDLIFTMFLYKNMPGLFYEDKSGIFWTKLKSVINLPLLGEKSCGSRESRRNVDIFLQMFAGLFVKNCLVCDCNYFSRIVKVVIVLDCVSSMCTFFWIDSWVDSG